jgi:hypothetical protein
VIAATVLLLGGCGGGGGPHLARVDAAPLISLAHRIPGEQPCAQARDIRALQAKAIVLVNTHRVPASLQDSLMSGVNALHEQTPVCLPAVPASTPPPPPPTTTEEAPSPAARHRSGEKHGHEHGHGPRHGKGGGD